MDKFTVVLITNKTVCLIHKLDSNNVFCCSLVYPSPKQKHNKAQIEDLK